MKYKIMFMALLAMCACAFLVSQADESNAETITGSCGTDLTYSYDTDTTVLTISGSGTTISYPSQFGGWPFGGNSVGPNFTEIVWNTPNLSTISSHTFRECTSLKSATIPSTVTSLGTHVYFGCTSLESIDIPNNLTFDSQHGVLLCSGCTNLVSVNLPNAIGIWDRTFHGCSSLVSIIVPEGVTKLDGYGGTAGNRVTTFSDCTSLREVDLPNSLITIYDSTFAECTSLQIVNIPENVTSINYGLFNGCSSLTNLELPNSITYIGPVAFNGCTSLASISIPENVTQVRSKAFKNCTNLKSVEYNAENVSSTYSRIDDYPFSGSINIQEIHIGEKVQNIPSHLFSLSVRTGLKTIYWDAINCADFTTSMDLFESTHPDTIIFGDSVKYIPAYLTKSIKSAVESVSFNDGLESIGAHAFDGCTNLAMVGLPDSVTEIGQQAFYGCTGILMPNLPSGIVNIHTGAFSGCPGVSISYLPATIEMIGNEAFKGCTAITKMVIPVGFDGTIGVNAFTDCTELSKILNLSELDIQLGSEDHGHIAYYADEVKNNIGSTAIVQQKQNVVHEVIEKSDAASKLLRVLPALMAIAVISFLCGLFYYRETERNRL